jgi:hypothetical protein
MFADDSSLLAFELNRAPKKGIVGAALSAFAPGVRRGFGRDEVVYKRKGRVGWARMRCLRGVAVRMI